MFSRYHSYERSAVKACTVSENEVIDKRQSVSRIYLRWHKYRCNNPRFRASQHNEHDPNCKIAACRPGCLRQASVGMFPLSRISSQAQYRDVMIDVMSVFQRHVEAQKPWKSELHSAQHPNQGPPVQEGLGEVSSSSRFRTCAAVQETHLCILDCMSHMSKTVSSYAQKPQIGSTANEQGFVPRTVGTKAPLHRSFHGLKSKGNGRAPHIAWPAAFKH